MICRIAAVRAVCFVGILGFAAGGARWSNGVAQGQQAAAPAQQTAAAEPLDLNIPANATADELNAFIQKLAKAKHEGGTEQEELARAKVVLSTIRDAAERMLAAQPTDKQIILAERYRLMALDGLKELGDPDAAKQYALLLDLAMNDPRLEVAKFAWEAYLVKHLSVWTELDAEAKDAFAAKILERVQRPQISPLEVSIVDLVASNLDHIDDAFAVKLLEQAIPVFKASKSEDVRAALDDSILEGLLRRMTLLGSEMEVFGDLLGGGQLDWKSYRGKVVLIDFSATWCEECMDELPKIQALYEQYKDKGFDVITVSADRTPEIAQQLVDDQGIKWATLFSPNEDERYLNNPMAKHYGVFGYPTMILVGKDGKVVNVMAYSHVLRQELPRLLGVAGSPAAAASATAAPTR
jgi:thiol-disulfide isomerase/thioredoxin